MRIDAWSLTSVEDDDIAAVDDDDDVDVVLTVDADTRGSFPAS